MFNFRRFLNDFIRNVFTSTGTKARYVHDSAKCINDNFWSRYENIESFARIEALCFSVLLQCLPLFLKLFIVLRKFMPRSSQRVVWIILREKIGILPFAKTFHVQFYTLNNLYPITWVFRTCCFIFISKTIEKISSITYYTARCNTVIFRRYPGYYG